MSVTTTITMATATTIITGARPLPKASDIKMIMSDVDGTLLDSHHNISHKNPNYKVIRRIRKAYPNLPIIVSTGKQWTANTHLRASLDLHPFNACHLQGNVIYNPDGSIISDSRLRPDVVRAAYEHVRAEKATLFLYEYSKVYQVLFCPADKDQSIWANIMRGYGEEVIECTGKSGEDIMRKVETGDVAVMKMAICLDEALLPAMSASFAAFPAGDFKITQALSFCVELIPFSHNKGTALVSLLKHMNDVNHLDIRAENVIVFGDGQNDVSMFKIAGMSVAMGNAMPSATKAAIWQTATSDEGGVGLFLEQVFFPST